MEEIVKNYCFKKPKNILIDKDISIDFGETREVPLNFREANKAYLDQEFNEYVLESYIRTHHITMEGVWNNHILITASDDSKLLITDNLNRYLYVWKLLKMKKKADYYRLLINEFDSGSINIVNIKSSNYSEIAKINKELFYTMSDSYDQEIFNWLVDYLNSKYDLKEAIINDSDGKLELTTSNIKLILNDEKTQNLYSEVRREKNGKNKIGRNR